MTTDNVVSFRNAKFKRGNPRENIPGDAYYTPAEFDLTAVENGDATIAFDSIDHALEVSAECLDYLLTLSEERMFLTRDEFDRGVREARVVIRAAAREWCQWRHAEVAEAAGFRDLLIKKGAL